MVKRHLSLFLAVIMVVSAILPLNVYAAVKTYEVIFMSEDDEILSSITVNKGSYVDESEIPAFPKGTSGHEDYIEEPGGKEHASYSWDSDPLTTPINANTVFTRVKSTEKHDYDFGKPQFKFQANSKSGLMAFYECSKCGSVGEVGVEIITKESNMSQGIKIRVDASAIGGNGIAYEGYLDVGQLQTIVNLMQKVGVPIPGWVNTVLSVADKVLDAADKIKEQTSTCSKEGHLYGENPTYTWSENKATCIARFECTREDCQTNYDGHYVEKAMNVTGPTYSNATCTENGEETYKASVQFQRGRDLDWEEYKTETKSVWQKKLGHNYTKVSNNNATCFEDGTYYRLCTRCGVKTADLVDTGTKKEHLVGRTVRENEVPATCTSKGSYNSVKYCVYCNTKLSDESVETDMLEHTPKAAVKENFTDSTCSALGSYDLVTRCADCNAVLQSEHKTIPKKSCTRRLIIEGATSSTCTTGGTYTQIDKCVECGKVYGSTTINLEPTAHDYENVTVVKPTCENEGRIDRVCKVCGYTIENAEIPDSLGGHNIELDSEIPATCASKGEKVYKCTNPDCDYVETEEIEKTANHTWDPNEIIEEPDCINYGTRTAVCTVCGTKKTTQIERTEHNYISVVTPATCTDRGYTTHTCSICGDVYIDSFSDAKGHKLGAVIRENEKDATCAEDGYYENVIKCSECGEELMRDEVEVPAKSHKFTKRIVKPTCISEGYTTYKCQNDACNHTEYTSAPKAITDHTPATAVKENVVKATCLEKGSYDSVVYCSYCKKELSRTAKVEKAKGHSWDNGVITKQPTTTESGIKLYTCKGCRITREEVIPKLTVKEATPSDKQADSASVNKTIRKPENIRTISQFNKKRLLILFDKVDGAQNYRVMYRKAGTKKWNYAWTDGATEYYLKNLKKGGLYEFMFAAYKKNSKNEWERGAYSKTSFRYYYKEKIKKVKAGKKSVTVKWTKDKNSIGYELFYATNPEMTNRKKIVINNKNTTSYTIKKLKKGKKYYIRVRSIKKLKNRRYTGEFSSQKKIKAK